MRIKDTSREWKKAQSYLEYAFLIGIAIGALLSMQYYLKRSFQGQMQLTTDQMATPYAPALMNSIERFTSRSSSTELETAGWGHPTTVTRIESHYNAGSTKEFKPLEATLVPKPE